MLLDFTFKIHNSKPKIIERWLLKNVSVIGCRYSWVMVLHIAFAQSGFAVTPIDVNAAQFWKLLIPSPKPRQADCQEALREDQKKISIGQHQYPQQHCRWGEKMPISLQKLPPKNVNLKLKYSVLDKSSASRPHLATNNFFHLYNKDRSCYQRQVMWSAYASWIPFRVMKLVEIIQWVCYAERSYRYRSWIK